MRNLLVASLALTLAFAGCIDASYGSASIYVKDAPTDDFAEIHVVFTEVRIHSAGNGTESDDNETAEDDGNETEKESSWMTLFENADGTDIDLLAANGLKSAFLGEATLETGKYTQIRIIVKEAYGIDHDGMRHDITVSSSTLKIVRSFNVEAGQESQITVDFDLDKSLKQTGNGSWRMTPVIGKTTVVIVEDSESGEDVNEEGEISESETLAESEETAAE